MQNVGQYAFKVQPMDVDFNECIRFIQMGGYLLHVAGDNAKENGFGIRLLHSEDIAWVLSRLAIEMYRYPKTDEDFHIETWIENFGRVFTTRNFKVTDNAGNIIGAATSIWCMMDMLTRKAVDFNAKSELEVMDFVTNIPSSIEKPARVSGIESPSVSRHRIKYSDIDFNRHTNSMKYLEWMIDLFPLENFINNRIRRIDINYMKEALFGEIVEIAHEKIDLNQYRFDMRRGDDEICRARILFENDI